MKKKSLLTILLFACCVTTYAQSAWSQKANFGGSARYSTNYFSIDSKGYIGMGYAGSRMVDLWEYDPALNTWTQKADFPSGGRNASACFTIGSEGYVVAGVNGVTFTTATYAYNGSTNTWSSKANFPTMPPPQDCMGFSIGTKGYVFGGYDGNVISYMYEYDAVTDSWAAKSSFPGIREGARGFVLNNKAYMGTGYDGSVVYNDFYCYDPSNDTWTPRANFPGVSRGAASCFNIGGYGYLGGGYDGNSSGTYYQDFYRYDPTNDTWTPVASYPGSGPAYTACFSIGNKGYVGTGGVYGGPYFTNFYEFSDVTSGLIENNSLNQAFEVFAPGNHQIIIRNNLKSKEKEVVTFCLYDLDGKIVMEEKIDKNVEVLNLPSNGYASATCYLFNILESNRSSQSGKVYVH